MALIVPGDIPQLLESGDLAESVEFEAKRASNALPGNAWATVSAFANTRGGVIVLGLEESESDWIISGVHEPDRMIQDIHNMMRNPQKISHEVAGNGDIWKEQIDGKWLVVVRVNRVARRDRPVFLDRDPSKAFVRRNEGDARCTESELARFANEASLQPWDMRVVPYLGMEDLDQPTIDRYRTLSQVRKPSLPHHRQAQPDFLRTIGAWRTDRETGHDGPTVAGILVFGTELAIREIRPSHVIDYRRIPSTSTATMRWSDRVRWTGNLFGAWEEIFPRLTRSLTTPFRLRGPQRIDQPAGEESLREAFVNLLVHTDYREPRDAVVLHRDSGYEFLNPGDSWVAVEDLGIESSFDRRNPVIASLFDHVGLADQAGSGYVRILDEWRELGYRPPTVLSDATRYEFSLSLGLADMLSLQDRTWLTDIGGPWTAPEEMALVYARHMESIDNATLRQATGQHLFDASQTLRSLRDRGLLVREGAGKNSYYVLGPAAQVGEGVAPASGDKGADEGLDAEWINREIARIAGPVKDQRRSAPAVIMDAIVDLCRLAPMSSAELARILERDQETLRPYLRTLIAERRIEPTLDPISHPRQRYRVVEAVSAPDARQQALDL
ncbi:MAG: RNA-binding domain-containing protein [Thermomicrobiales bacterium]